MAVGSPDKRRYALFNFGYFPTVFRQFFLCAMSTPWVHILRIVLVIFRIFEYFPGKYNPQLFYGVLMHVLAAF